MLKKLLTGSLFWRTVLAAALALVIAAILIAPNVDLPSTVLTVPFASFAACVFLFVQILSRTCLRQFVFRWTPAAYFLPIDPCSTDSVAVLRC